MKCTDTLLRILSLGIGLCLPASDLLSFTCGSSGNEHITELAMPRAGVDSTNLGLEGAVHSFPNDSDLGEHIPPGDTVEFHSGFGWQLVNFNGPDEARFHHLIELYDADNPDSLIASNDTTVTLSTEGKIFGYLCVFETYANPDTLDRKIWIESHVSVEGDTLESEGKWVVRRIFVVE